MAKDAETAKRGTVKLLDLPVRAVKGGQDVSAKGGATKKSTMPVRRPAARRTR